MEMLLICIDWLGLNSMDKFKKILAGVFEITV